MKTSLTCFSMIVGLVLAVTVAAQEAMMDTAETVKRYQAAAKKYGLSVVDKPRYPLAGIRANALSDQALPKAYEEFFEAISVYPPMAFKLLRWKQIAMCENFIVGDTTQGYGVLTGNLLVMAMPVDTFWLHVTVYRTIDGLDGYAHDNKWLKANPPKFKYMTWDKIQAVKEDDPLLQAFVGRDCMLDIYTDMAYTFGSMMTAPRYFEERARNNPHLKRKGELIREALKRFYSGLDETFWAQVLEMADAKEKKAAAASPPAPSPPPASTGVHRAGPAESDAPL